MSKSIINIFLFILFFAYKIEKILFPIPFGPNIETINPFLTEKKLFIGIVFLEKILSELIIFFISWILISFNILFTL